MILFCILAVGSTESEIIVPCSESHKRLLDQNYSEVVRQSLAKNEVQPQGLIAGDLETIYYDEFKIIVEMPSSLSPEQIFRDMRRGLDATGRGNGCMKFRKLANFKLWRRANGEKGYGITAEDSICNNYDHKEFNEIANLGDIYSIDIFGLDNGNVIVSDLYQSPNQSYFRYTTLYAKSFNPFNERRGHHPNRGAREYGFKRYSDGSIVFYVRGADQWEGLIAEGGNYLPFILALFENLFREGEHELVTAQQKFWLSFLRGIGERVEKMGGSVLQEARLIEYEEDGLPECFIDGGFSK